MVTCCVWYVISVTKAHCVRAASGCSPHPEEAHSSYYPRVLALITLFVALDTNAIVFTKARSMQASALCTTAYRVALYYQSAITGGKCSNVPMQCP
jgi:hypothetical protein